MARAAGHELTTDAADAEVLVVNTCAFIDSAKQESIDAILEMAAHKRDGRCSRLVVTGCLAERYRDELRREIPEIDAVLGTGEVEGIVDAIGSPVVRSRGSSEGPEASAIPIKFFAKSPSTRTTEHAIPRTTDRPGDRAPERPSDRAPSYRPTSTTPTLPAS